MCECIFIFAWEPTCLMVVICHSKLIKGHSGFLKQNYIHICMYLHTQERRLFRKKCTRELKVVFLGCESWIFFLFLMIQTQNSFIDTLISIIKIIHAYIFLILKIQESIRKRKKNKIKIKTQLQDPQNCWWPFL